VGLIMRCVRKFLKKIKVKINYFTLRNCYRFPLNRFDYLAYPSKDLLHHCFQKFDRPSIKYLPELVAHMVAYDSTVTYPRYKLVFQVYGNRVPTRERLRQLLLKFVKDWYKYKK